MANTQLLKTRIEPFVRQWLAEKFERPFSSQFLQLAGCSGVHEFDAVSKDKRIVCGIKSSSGPTSGGKNPSGKISGAYEELYFLAGVDADQRFLVLTDKDFYELLSRKMREKLTRGIKLLYCPDRGVASTCKKSPIRGKRRNRPRETIAQLLALRNETDTMPSRRSCGHRSGAERLGRD